MRHFNVLLIAFIMLCAGALQAQPTNRPGFISVFGTVTKGDKKDKEAHVRIYEGNNLWADFNVNSKAYFESMLELNKYYTFEFSSNGAISKHVVFDTSVQQNGFIPVPFECYVDLVPSSLFPDADVSILDYPISIVRFNAKEKYFEPDMRYTANMMKEFDKAMANKDK
jgi:hypothetical protein